jgi:hypothetical protein
MNKGDGMNQKKVDIAKARYISILQEYDWDWWGRLSFPPSERFHDRILDEFDDWLHDLKSSLGDEDFRWARTYEKGRSGADDTLRILIGGLESRRDRWRARWSHDPLRSRLHHFNKRHSLDAMDYLLGSMDKNGKVNIKYHLRPRRD